MLASIRTLNSENLKLSRYIETCISVNFLIYLSKNLKIILINVQIFVIHLYIFKTFFYIPLIYFTKLKKLITAIVSKNLSRC